MDRRWVEFLRTPSAAAHAVQLYTRVEELAESVAAYLATGFAAGDPAVVIATREHHAVFMHFLAATGWDGETLSESGLLTHLDAAETLSAFDDGEQISARRFERTVGGVVDAIADRFPGRHVRAFGEMVDILSRAGRHTAAARLERLWNELADARRFSLLCGYRLDVFDQTTQAGVLPAVCDAHTHVRPVYDSARLDRAVCDALDEVLGPSSARMVHGIVTDGDDASSAPLAERLLLWISARMPHHADRVLALAREQYARTAVGVS